MSRSLYFGDPDVDQSSIDLLRDLANRLKVILTNLNLPEKTVAWVVAMRTAASSARRIPYAPNRAWRSMPSSESLQQLTWVTSLRNIDIYPLNLNKAHLLDELHSDDTVWEGRRRAGAASCPVWFQFGAFVLLRNPELFGTGTLYSLRLQVDGSCCCYRSLSWCHLWTAIQSLSFWHCCQTHWRRLNNNNTNTTTRLSGQ